MMRMPEPERDMRTECYSCKYLRRVPGNAHIMCVKPDYAMRGNAHGIRNGWFLYPFVFDPVWKEQLCANYERREEV